MKQVNAEWTKDMERREKRLESIEQLLKKEKHTPPPQWYVNGQGQTMVVIPGPVGFPDRIAGGGSRSNVAMKSQHKKKD